MLLLLALLAAFVFAPPRPPATPTPASTVPANLPLQSGQTGVPLAPASPENRAAVNQAIQDNGSPLVQRSQTDQDGTNRYALYRLDTGQTFPFFADNPEEYINVDAIGVTAGRALWLKQGDNGMAGHSSFASSLWCSDGNGRTVWRYPTRTYYNGEFLIPETGALKNPAEYTRLYRDVLGAVLCGRRTEEPIVVCQVRHGNTYFLDGLRVRDGKRLWSFPDPVKTSINRLYSVSDTTSGAFSLQVHTDPKTVKPQSARLDYLNAATGKTRPVKALPKTTAALAIKGDNLTITDANGTMRVYSVKKLLSK